MKRYIGEFLFFFVFIALFMYAGTTLFKVWPDDARFGICVAFALGSSISHVAMSIIKNYKRKN